MLQYDDISPDYDLWGVITVPLTVVAVLWLARPVLDWWRASSQTLEAHLARTSFHAAPGELVHPAWKAPQLTLSVVVPACNEELRLPLMLRETLAYLRARAAAAPGMFTYEVVVVDDGSWDATYAVAVAQAVAKDQDLSWSSGFQRPLVNSASPEVRVVRLASNCGKGFAVKVGVAVARGELLLVADADGSTDIRALEQLERSLGAQDGPGPHVAVGSRQHMKANCVGMPAPTWRRNLLMSVFHFISWLLVGSTVEDTRCGFELFRAPVGKRLFSALHLHGWAFDVELLLMMRCLGWPVAQVPVTWVEMPGSKMNKLTAPLGMIRDVVLLQALYAFGVWRPSA